MRLHISLDDDLVQQLDARVGSRRRSTFISETVRRALEDDRRWQDIEAGLGALSDNDGDWGADPAAWVTEQRFQDASRVG
jgi:Arc/MetJ-type ribon-helix-helix transcriptional regulator